MAHLLTQRGAFVEFAFTGDRSGIWHRLGNEIAPDAPRSEWERLSGLSYTVESAPVQFTPEGSHSLIVPDRRVFYRSDTREALGVHSDGYKPVQPSEILDFLFDLCKTFGYKMTTAGTLLGGKRYWAQIAIGAEDRIVGDDMVSGYLGFVTSADGTLASTIKNCATRWVCNNTIRIGLGDMGNVFRFDHRSRFDNQAASKALGLVADNFATFIQQARTLALMPVTQTDCDRFLVQLLGSADLTKPAADLTEAESKAVADVRDSRGYKLIADLFQGNARGAWLPGVKGTAWGMLNAVTEYADHHMRALSEGHRMNSAQSGAGATLKDAALAQATAMID